MKQYKIFINVDEINIVSYSVELDVIAFGAVALKFSAV